MPDAARPGRRVVIADDEPYARERLRLLLEAHPHWTVVGEAEHGREAVETIARERPDLVFLDIRMPELDGMEVAATLDAGTGGPAVVFVTAHEEFALRAFEVRALDYLLKPVDAERLGRALAGVEARLAAAPAARPAGMPDGELRAFLAALGGAPSHPRRFMVRDVKGGLYFVRAEEIDWVEARGNYVGLHAGGRLHLVRDTMRAFESKLDPAVFVRVHRSAIVSLDHVERLEPFARGEYLLILRDGTKLQSSRTHSARLRALLE